MIGGGRPFGSLCTTVSNRTPLADVCLWSGAGAANIEIDATLLTVKPQMPTSGIEQAVSKFVDPLSGLLEPVNFLRS